MRSVVFLCSSSAHKEELKEEGGDDADDMIGTEGDSCWSDTQQAYLDSVLVFAKALVNRFVVALPLRFTSHYNHTQLLFFFTRSENVDISSMDIDVVKALSDKDKNVSLCLHRGIYRF